MGKIGEFIRGRRFTKDDVVEDGIPSIHYGEIYTQYGTATSKTVSHVRRELAGQLRFAQPGDVVIAAVGETVEDVAKAVAWLGDEPVAIHDDTFLFRSDMNAKFVSYAMQTAAFHAQKNKYVARAKVKRLGGESLAKICIPVPSRPETGAHRRAPRQVRRPRRGPVWRPAYRGRCPRQPVRALPRSAPDVRA